ncbi:MAG: MaoC family dehydratase N-terminal domain-containing protein [Ilumatobacteraceae bacterium]
MADVDLNAIRERWVGKVFQEFDLVIDEHRMLEWAISCGETDPRYVDPEHPDFQASTAFPTHLNIARALPEDFTQIGSGRGIDGGKSIEWHLPMRAGDRLHAAVEIADVYAKSGRSGTMTFIVNRMTYTNPDGAVVATVDWRMIRQD